MENKNEKIFPNFDPTSDLSQAGKNRRLKRGLGAKPLMESEIKKAQNKARSAMEAARILGVSFNTYKKYAKKYGIFEDLKNPDGNGIRKGYNIKRGKFFETSCTYRMVPVMGMSLDKLIKELKEDIKKHQKEGNYYKCLKRMRRHREHLEINYLQDVLIQMQPFVHR